MDRRKQIGSKPNRNWETRDMRNNESSLKRSPMIRFPQEFILQRDISAVQVCGDPHIESIPCKARVVAERVSNNPEGIEESESSHSPMIEVVWDGERYLVFEEDLKERASCAATLEHK